MSSQITTAFVQQYSANIQMLSQQMGSLLRDKVRLESVVGKNSFFGVSEINFSLFLVDFGGARQC